MCEIIHNQLEVEQLWIEAILGSNTTSAQNILSRAKQSEKNQLLNGDMTFCSLGASCLPFIKRLSKHFGITRPFHMAAASKSFDILVLLVEQGCDVFVTDKYGNNVIHILSYIECLKPEDESGVTESYKKLSYVLTKEEIVHLLTMKNTNNLTPLQCASSLGALGIFQNIFETKGSYASQLISVPLIT